MATLRGVDFTNGSQTVTIKPSGQADERWPEPAVHVGDLATDQAAHEDVGRLANRTRKGEDLTPFDVAPPAAAYRCTGDCLGEARDRPAGAFEDDAAPTDECYRSSRCHRAATSERRLTVCDSR
jgi:hypothetical protein